MVILAGMALIVGSGGALGAWVLLKLIALATNLFWFRRLSAETVLMTAGVLGTLLVPVLGGLVVGLMARFGSDKIRGHGIPEAIETILYGESRLSVKVALLKPVSSAISIGSGGPFGAEGPIIMTGGAIGSVFAQCFHLSAAERKTLLVAGAAAGMTAIFGTPIAAILLAVEVLLFEWKPRSFVPVVAAALVSLAWRPWLFGSGPMFPTHAAPLGHGWELLASGGIGLAVGAGAALLSVLLYFIEDAFTRLPVHWMWWPALGAVVVGLGGLVDHRVLGAGYSNIQALLDGAVPVHSATTLLLVKAVVWLVALGSGTSGGILAPILILGGSCGSLIGQLLPGDAGFWAMVGMAGIMSGAMRAPLTGALFAAEVTGHFDALPFTIAAAGSAYAISVLLTRRSILTEKIARRGRHILHEYTVDPLDLQQAGQLMTPNPQTLPGSMPISEALDFFANQARFRTYPVVDADDRLLGVASRTDALRWQVDHAAPDLTLADAMADASPPVSYPETPASVVADLILETGIGRIPIIDRASHRVLGILSRQDLLKPRGLARHAEVGRARFVGGSVRR